MKINCEYTLKIKVNEVILSDNINEDKLEEIIKQKGKEALRAYLSGYLFDPDKKIITEKITFEHKL